jgi:hypothetical protein
LLVERPPQITTSSTVSIFRMPSFCHPQAVI